MPDSVDSETVDFPSGTVSIRCAEEDLPLAMQVCAPLARLQAELRPETSAKHPSGSVTLEYGERSNTALTTWVELANDSPIAKLRFDVLRWYLNCLELVTSQVLSNDDQVDTLFTPGGLQLTHAADRLLIPTDFDGLVSVGRGAHCQICLSSAFVSRLHGCFRWTNEGFSYRDMSQNGTLLQTGHEELLIKDDEVVLRRRGTLVLGDQRIDFECHE